MLLQDRGLQPRWEDRHHGLPIAVHDPAEVPDAQEELHDAQPEPDAAFFHADQDKRDEQRVRVQDHGVLRIATSLTFLASDPRDSERATGNRAIVIILQAGVHQDHRLRPRVVVPSARLRWAGQRQQIQIHPRTRKFILSYLILPYRTRSVLLQRASHLVL